MSLSPLNLQERQQVLDLAQTLAPVDREAFATLYPVMRVRHLAPQEALFQVGDHPAMECFVLDGLLRSWLGDAHGRAVTLDFHAGPCALTPAIARSSTLGRSRIQCEALAATRVVLFSAEALSQCMVQHSSVAGWGNAVLTQELMRRVDKELALATQTARDRFLTLCAEHPTLLGSVAQHHLASYLGITPVSLSRLRGQLRGPQPAQTSAAMSSERRRRAGS